MPIWSAAKRSCSTSLASAPSAGTRSSENSCLARRISRTALFAIAQNMSRYIASSESADFETGSKIMAWGADGATASAPSSFWFAHKAAACSALQRLNFARIRSARSEVGPSSESRRDANAPSIMPRSASTVSRRSESISGSSGTPSSRTSPIRSSARCARDSMTPSPKTRQLPLKVCMARNSAAMSA